MFPRVIGIYRANMIMGDVLSACRRVLDGTVPTRRREIRLDGRDAGPRRPTSLESKLSAPGEHARKVTPENGRPMVGRNNWRHIRV